MERFGVDVESDRPAADTVLAGTTYTLIDGSGDFDTWISDGTDWEEI